MMKSITNSIVIFLLLIGFGTKAQESKMGAKEWIEDLLFLKEFAEKSHFHLFHTMDSKDWDVEVQNLQANIPKMKDHEVILSLMKLLANVKDGHTLLFPPYQGKFAFRTLPLEFYFFEEELFVRAALPAYEKLVGKKIVKTGGKPIQELLTKLKSYLGQDNEYSLKWTLPLALQCAEAYGLTNENVDFENIEFTYFENGTEQTIKVRSGPLQWNPMTPFAPDHWVQMKDLGDNLWTKNPNDAYWYEYLPANKIVYFQYNQILDKADKSVSAFVDELFRFIDENETRALVIDIRLNNGGNNFLNKPLIHNLICNQKINQRGKLFVITGRRTFSAAMNLASDLEQHTNAIFVGEPTGSSPNFYGEDFYFQLPNSGLAGTISSRYWQGGRTSDDKRKWISPELPAILTVDDFRNGVDPCMKTIEAFLENAE